jgi:hypothetical protein
MGLNWRSSDMVRLPFFILPFPCYTDPLALADEYKPILDEIIRLQEKAGLDAAEIRTAARAGLGTESRNRR